MAETAKSEPSDHKLPLSIEHSVKPDLAHADEDSIVLKLNSENDSEAEPDSPQPGIKADLKKSTPEASQKTTDCASAVDPAKADAKASQPDRKKSNFFWVSNIQREVKAADLKALFSKVGKVCTAKILTNGKCFYGYVSMESYAMSLKCVKQFNNTPLDGVNITVSKMRPDLTAAKSDCASKRAKKKVEDVAEAEPLKVEDDQLQKTVTALRKKVDDLTFDNARLRRKLDGYQKRHDGMRNTCLNLERDVKKLREENREERRALSQEKQSFERDRQQTITRIKADREEVAKNLGEVRKLKERLKFAVARSSSPYKRDRSPFKRPSRNVSPIAKPRAHTSSAKRSRHEEYVAAPPAPKLDAEASRKRYSDVSSVPHFEFRHKPAEAGRPSGGHWPGPYPRDARSKLTAAGYPLGGRYGSGVPPSPAGIVMSSRSGNASYYQPW